MATTAERSYFLIERGGKKKRILGSNLDKLQKDDILIINRGDNLMRLRWEDKSTLSKIEDSDLFVIYSSTLAANYRVTGKSFKDLIPLDPMVIDYYHFVGNDTQVQPYPIQQNEVVRHRWSVSNAKTVVVKNGNLVFEEHQDDRRVTYGGNPGFEGSWVLTATDFEGNVITEEITYVMTGPKVQVTKFKCPGGVWHAYAAPLEIEWETRHAKDFEIDGWHQYAVYTGEYARDTYTTYRYPSEDRNYTIKGEAFSKYDDSTDYDVGTVYVRGISMVPGNLTNTKDNLSPGGKMHPQFSVNNSLHLENAGASISRTWDLVGMTKNEEECSFAIGSLVDHYFDGDGKNPPTIHRRSKTKNGPITLRVEAVNSHNYERVRAEHKFTCNM